jgi:hypothetical protein
VHSINITQRRRGAEVFNFLPLCASAPLREKFFRGIRAAVAILGLLLPISIDAQDAKKGDWKPLFDGKSLAGWKVTDFGGEGEVTVDNGQILMRMGQPLTGITWKDGDAIPKDNFEVSLQAMKRKGDDFFCALTFPVRDSHATFVMGGWAGTVVGLSSINGSDASENETTQYEKFDQNKWYTVRVRVADGKVECWIDDKQMVEVELAGKRISTRIEVDPNKPLGICCYNTESALKDIRLRRVEK